MHANVRYFLILALLSMAGPKLLAQSPSRATLLADVATLSETSGRFRVGVHVKFDPGWHGYWINSGDSGMPPAIEWELPEGVRADGPLQFPAPIAFAEGDMVSFGYEKEVLLIQSLLLERPPPEDGLTLKARANWLVCRDICIPVSSELLLHLPLQPGEEPPRDLFERMARRLPVESAGWEIEARASETAVRICLTAPEGTPLEAAAPPRFFPLQRDLLRYRMQDPWERREARLCVELPRFPGGVLPPRLQGVLVLPPDGQAPSKALAVDVPLTRME